MRRRQRRLRRRRALVDLLRTRALQISAFALSICTLLLRLKSRSLNANSPKQNAPTKIAKYRKIVKHNQKSNLQMERRARARSPSIRVVEFIGARGKSSKTRERWHAVACGGVRLMLFTRRWRRRQFDDRRETRKEKKLLQERRTPRRRRRRQRALKGAAFCVRACCRRRRHRRRRRRRCRCSVIRKTWKRASERRKIRSRFLLVPQPARADDRITRERASVACRRSARAHHRATSADQTMMTTFVAVAATHDDARCSRKWQCCGSQPPPQAASSPFSKQQRAPLWPTTRLHTSARQKR